jgi:hypothetical protein
VDEGDKSDTAARFMLMATKRRIIGRKRHEDASSMREAGPCLLEDGDWITCMLNNVAQQNKIKFIARSIDFQDVARQKTESGLWFKGTSPNARLVHVKPYPTADACNLAQAVQHAALVTPEVADGQAGERDMRGKPRNKDVLSDRVLVVKVGEPVREKLCPEEILERSHWERPIPIPGGSRARAASERVGTMIGEGWNRALLRLSVEQAESTRADGVDSLQALSTSARPALAFESDLPLRFATALRSRTFAFVGAVDIHMRTGPCRVCGA